MASSHGWWTRYSVRRTGALEARGAEHDKPTGYEAARKVSAAKKADAITIQQAPLAPPPRPRSFRDVARLLKSCPS
jgi:hypothetical protein